MESLYVLKNVKVGRRERDQRLIGCNHVASNCLILTRGIDTVEYVIIPRRVFHFFCIKKNVISCADVPPLHGCGLYVMWCVYVAV